MDYTNFLYNDNYSNTNTNNVNYINKKKYKHLIREIKIKKDPVDVFELFRAKKFPMFFDSSLKMPDIGRYSIIVFDPFLVISSHENNIKIQCNDQIQTFKSDPFKLIKSLINQYKTDFHENLPFISGCAGYFSYNLNSLIENIKDENIDNIIMPDIFLGFYNKSIIFDHLLEKTFISASNIGLNYPYDTYESLNKTLASLEAEILNAEFFNTDSTDNTYNTHEVNSLLDNFKLSNKFKPISNFSKDEYIKNVEKAKNYIKNGDIFQVNISQQFECPIFEEPHKLYYKLRKINSAPFSAYLDIGDVKILSSSPERFIKIHKNEIETRPIKGTCPRGTTKEEDLAFQDMLINSLKDRAELTMIVDLERNDLGKICKIGSVKVEKQLNGSIFRIEKYATVHHLVSVVKGILKNETDPIDCILNTFPGGSITGAPKIRSMEIIEELEPVRRNLYTGSIGYINFDGNCDFNIAIRTIITKSNNAYYNVGGGIVWDSIPEKEYEETLHKGKAIMQTLMCSNSDALGKKNNNAR